VQKHYSKKRRNDMTVQKRALWVLAVVAVFALVSCATVGKDIDRTHLPDIGNGVQDKNQIRDWFGEPNGKMLFSANTKGCVERWSYLYGHASYGGLKTKSTTLVIDFDERGKVCDHAYSETK
jgi:outer membrane protein assembly factor BamE (lipoprotein component of BamABCDE complex)